MATSYQVGDVLLCHKHIGVARFVGKLHRNDYRQLPSASQTCIKPSDIWVGLQLAEKPDLKHLSLMKPNSKHQQSLRALAYNSFHSIPFRDYFNAHYGLLIPYHYIHRKIPNLQMLITLTELFHSIKRTQKRNDSLSRKVETLQAQLADTQTTKKVQSTSQKSMESIIVDQNGNEYRHKQKIIHTTTHSFQSSHTRFSSKDQDEESPTTSHHGSSHHSHSQTNSKPHGPSQSASTSNSHSHSHSHSTRHDDDHHSDHETETPLTLDRARESETQTMDTESKLGDETAETVDTETAASTMKCLSDDLNCASNSLSEKAIDGVAGSGDSYSDRNISELGDIEEDEKMNELNRVHSQSTPSSSNAASGPIPIASNASNPIIPTTVPTLTDLLSQHTFNPEQDIINEDNEEDYNMVTTNNVISTRQTSSSLSGPRPASPAISNNRGGHYRRFSAPINGNRHFSTDSDSGNKRRDSTELNMLQMIKEDPEMHGIYQYISKQQGPERHTRSQSVIHVPRYFFEIDHETPDLPDL